MGRDPNDIEKLAEYLLGQISAFVKIGDYEEFPASEMLAALELLKMELGARVLQECGFHRWPKGMDAMTAQRLRREPFGDRAPELDDTQELGFDGLDADDDDEDEDEEADTECEED